MNYISIYLNFCLDKGDHLTPSKFFIKLATVTILLFYKKINSFFNFLLVKVLIFIHYIKITKLNSLSFIELVIFSVF